MSSEHFNTFHNNGIIIWSIYVLSYVKLLAEGLASQQDIQDRISVFDRPGRGKQHFLLLYSQWLGEDVFLPAWRLKVFKPPIWDGYLMVYGTRKNIITINEGQTKIKYRGRKLSRLHSCMALHCTIAQDKLLHLTSNIVHRRYNISFQIISCVHGFGQQVGNWMPNEVRFTGGLTFTAYYGPKSRSRIPNPKRFGNRFV